MRVSISARRVPDELAEHGDIDGAFLRNANTPDIGYTESARDYAAITETGSFFISPNGNSKWFSASELGVSIGACRQVH
ncbi:MAG TPA: hypothetical protein VE243_07305 [Candidatus Acidoferrum sp.]|nr:hypothetical protein [Candidatus Acidoferrum sp.]